MADSIKLGPHKHVHIPHAYTPHSYIACTSTTNNCSTVSPTDIFKNFNFLQYLFKKEILPISFNKNPLNFHESEIVKITSLCHAYEKKGQNRLPQRNSGSRI